MDEHSGKALLAGVTALPGHGVEVERLLGDYAVTVRREPGNRVFAVYRQEARPEHFIVYEIYADRTAFDAHRAAPANPVVNASLTEGSGSELTFLTPVG